MTEMSMQMIPSGELAESPLNPRKRFRDVEDLAESIREQGILEPLLVRANAPRPVGKFFPFEVIAGARRLRAGRLAGLAEFPCVVRAMDDAQALEAMLAENNQRDDVSPLEEADAFGELQKLGRSIEDIAGRLGRSVGYVRTRLRLLELVPEVRALLDEGRIHVGSALLLAQVHEEQQREAADQIRRGAYRPRRRADDPWSSADVAALLQDRSRRVSLALWPLNDDELVPAAGACTTCPRRTGSQRALLVEMEGDDVCLDAACWASKTTATVEAARARGELVLEGPALELAFDTGVFIGLDDHCDGQDFPEPYGDDEQYEIRWREALSRIGVTVVTSAYAVHPTGRVDLGVSAGHLADLVEAHWPQAARALRQRAADFDRSQPARADAPRHPSEADADAAELDDVETTAHAEEQRARAEKEKADRAKAELERRAQEIARAELAAKVVAYAEGHMPDEGTQWLHALARVALGGASAEACLAILKRRGLPAGTVAKTASPYEAARKGIEAWLVTTPHRGAVAGLLAELTVTPALQSQWLFSESDPSGTLGPHRVLFLLAAVGAGDIGAALRAARKRLADEEKKASKKAPKGPPKIGKKGSARMEATGGA